MLQLLNCHFQLHRRDITGGNMVGKDGAGAAAAGNVPRLSGKFGKTPGFLWNSLVYPLGKF